MLSIWLLSAGAFGLAMPPSTQMDVAARPYVSRAALRLSDVAPWDENAVSNTYVPLAKLKAASEAVLKPMREAADKAAAKEAAAAAAQAAAREK
jgi:hypothetical protein